MGDPRAIPRFAPRATFMRCGPTPKVGSSLLAQHKPRRPRRRGAPTTGEGREETGDGGEWRIADSGLGSRRAPRWGAGKRRRQGRWRWPVRRGRRMLRRRRGRKGGWSSVNEAGGCGIGWRAKRGVGRVTSKGATLARTRTRSHVWALDQVGPRPSSGVGECLDVRQVSGVAVDR
eukprot:scaffold11479_cov115-Isochrysis_galbana.AAC.4